MLPAVEVTEFEIVTDYTGLTITVTVRRLLVPAQQSRAVRVSDLPADIREGLKNWLEGSE
jgi:hypothetical protein